jgi:hypothetical protein
VRVGQPGHQHPLPHTNQPGTLRARGFASQAISRVTGRLRCRDGAGAVSAARLLCALLPGTGAPSRPREKGRSWNEVVPRLYGPRLRLTSSEGEVFTFGPDLAGRALMRRSPTG